MKYYCNGYRAIKDSQAKNFREAATIFATRMARNAYGKHGLCHFLNETAHSTDYTVTEWQAYIGRKTKQNETTGHNIQFTIKKAS